VPVTYEIDPGSRLIRTRCAGDVRVAEILEHFAALLADSALPERPDVLLDLSQTTSNPDSGQIHAVAEEVKVLREKLRWGAIAIVAQRDLLFGMSRVFEVFAQPAFREIRVFRDHAEAEAWLASRPGGA
jgi:hypothetical protein